MLYFGKEVIQRPGKTRRDRFSGANARNQANKATRVAWEKTPNRKNKDFPFETCNGKKNRHR